MPLKGVEQLVREDGVERDALAPRRHPTRQQNAKLAAVTRRLGKPLVSSDT